MPRRTTQSLPRRQKKAMQNSIDDAKAEMVKKRKISVLRTTNHYEDDPEIHKDLNL